MKVKLLFFATHKRVAGLAEAEAELPPASTARDAAKHAEDRYGVDLKGSLVAVNETYAEPEQALTDGDTVAFIPPVAGGADAPDRFLLTGSPLDLQALREPLAGPAWGGQACFIGTTRTPNRGLDVAYHEYEAYTGMVEGVMRQIAAEARARWDLGAVVLAHRTGRVHPGEPSIFVGVAAGHRRPVFEALPFLVDEAKARLPVWKLEVGPDGERRVEGSVTASTPL